MSRIVLVANGSLSQPESVQHLLRSGDRVVAVDGGAHLCRTLGLAPSVLIGDLDSIDDCERRRLEAAGVSVQRYPVRKDQTDLDLALDWCREAGASEVLILGAWGGRWDQTLANFLLLQRHASAACRIQVADGRHTAMLLRGPATWHIESRPGDIVSLLALSEAARGVTTCGLEYVLADGTLACGSTLGLSNRVAALPASVAVREGALLGIHIRSLP